jgi:outer membrane protein assembly factor BamB
MPNQIVAYDLASGSTAYTVDTPNNGLCKASGQSSKGLIVVLRGTRAEGCRQVTVVDITHGKVVWSKNLQPAGAPRPDRAGAQHFPRLSHRPAILGDRIYVPTDKGMHILKASDGSIIGTPPDPKLGKCYTTHVDVIDATGFAYRNCSRHGGREGLHLTAFNAAGNTIYRWNLPVAGNRPWMLAAVLSANPLIVRAYNQQQSQIWRVDPKTGKHNVVVDLSNRFLRGPAPADPCAIAGSDGLYECRGQITANDVLYLQHRLGTQSSDVRQGIAAYDVRSGKQLWLREWGEDHDVTPPIGVDGDGAPVVYLLPKEKDPGALVRVDPRNSGMMTAIATVPRAENPDSRSLIASPEPGGVAWHNNQLAFLRIQINVKDAGDDATTILK